MLISFLPFDIVVPKFNEKKIKSWINQVAKSNQKKIGDISFFYCSNSKITALNKQILSHPFPTDIITINQVTDNILSGEIFIGLETIKENAKIYKVSFKNELFRVMIHGVLHLIGNNDSTQADKKQMRNKENFALKLLLNQSKK